ncbi:MAG: hypothetical protein BWY63_00169 [Chloroflexi bacterium ADurb.Bin360]|nr:MAG: hypothetical protein BWY63_00169 [Chloroflexi bacterium ADurb.Bin360]
MLPWLGSYLVDFYGPFRLFSSYLFLATLGTALANAFCFPAFGTVCRGMAGALML